MKYLRSAWLLISALFFSNGLHAEPDSLTISFTITQDRVVYEESDYGEPPQVAIWLEDPVTGTTRTVYVTYRTGTGRFAGKVECPVALPIWVKVYRREFGREGFPNPRSGAPEAITRATSRTETINAQAIVPRASRWRYYVEMNVAGDFNRAFPLEREDQRLDYHGNGQPSLVYAGEIVAEPDSSSIPQPVGRSDQYQFSGELIPDIKGLDSALRVFKKIEVVCLKK